MSAITGLFETVLVRNGVMLRLKEHIERLLRSAAENGLTRRDNPIEFLRGCRPLPDGRLRITLVDGFMKISITPFPGYPEELYREGAVAMPADIPGHPLGARAGHKSLPYDIMIEARERAREHGAIEVLFTDTDGALLEGAVSNLFVVIEGVLLTPPLTRPILPGVTRAAVLSLAGEMGIEAREADLYPPDLRKAQEAFLTSSLMLAMPLRKFGQTALRLGSRAAEFRARLLS